MGVPSGNESKPGRGLTYIIAGMVVGLVFLLLVCGLIGWNFAVAPVSRSLAFAAIGLGALSATAILISVAAYYLSNRQQ
jgi:hypothetical protein